MPSNLFSNLGHRKENQEKNRNPLIVPPDERRPYLTSFISHFNSTTNSDAGVYCTIKFSLTIALKFIQKYANFF